MKPSVLISESFSAAITSFDQKLDSTQRYGSEIMVIEALEFFNARTRRPMCVSIRTLSFHKVDRLPHNS